MSTRNYQPGDSYGIGFTTKSATGALADADALPTAALYRNGAVDGAVAVPVTRLSLGDYSASCTLPGGYAPGDRCSIKVLATIGGVATGDYVDHIRLVGWPNTVGAAGCLPVLVVGTAGALAVPSKLAPDGIDNIVIETGVNARQALSAIGAATAGVLSGAAGTTVAIAAMGNPSTPRISTTVDVNGNRTAATLTLPA